MRDALCVRDVARVPRGEGDVAATVGRISDQVLEGAVHHVLHVAAILFAHATGQRERLEVAAGAHAHRCLAEAELGQVKLPVGWETSDTLQGPVVRVLLASRHLQGGDAADGV